MANRHAAVAATAAQKVSPCKSVKHAVTGWMDGWLVRWLLLHVIKHNDDAVEVDFEEHFREVVANVNVGCGDSG